ncbi:4-alpha-glucanotransferase [Chitinispirillales bacterium ANBcel5]|uniref:4-alpha-glucanotransferase n=1 Tax=Cellulosispirillum alkaliphilum TaxID=3039283 RepID=UPI002A543411|nr:4-alpha-glucanotransferase [Chitinispirillales bacterium ANBcel5]
MTINKRSSGILLAISSLPSLYGCGDFGDCAYRFAQLLHAHNQRLWQILPINPTRSENNHSPYSSTSSFALNKLFLSPQHLFSQGLISKSDLNPLHPPEFSTTDYSKAYSFKNYLLSKAWFRVRSQLPQEYHCFCHQNCHWLEDYSLFEVISSRMKGLQWQQWPDDLKKREPKALQRFSQEFKEEIDREKFTQFLLETQFKELKTYCNEKKISIIGDIPFYLNSNSVECWKEPHLFKLNEHFEPAFLSGVPPDPLSPHGQCWRNPVYNWETMRNDSYRFWKQRLKRSFDLYDLVRIDHFRAFVAYWEIDAAHRDATKGSWVRVDSEGLFKELLSYFSSFPVIAEDLGTITSDVREVMKRFSIPGMRVLQFGFDSNPDNHHLPHNYPVESLACSSTHDTNTLYGWYLLNKNTPAGDLFCDYIGGSVSDKGSIWQAIRLLFLSPANLVVVPIQDVLCTGDESRMNNPVQRGQNWVYRLSLEQMENAPYHLLAKLSYMYGRV